MIEHVAIDTGPLVAFLNRKDHFHAWARARFSEIAPPLLTCEPVLAESCFLLQGSPGGSAAVLELLQRGIIQIAFSLDEQAAVIRKLMAKYERVPMSLADACLVRMSELNAQCTILTMDSDFLIYRRHSRQAIPLISPEKR